MSVYLSMSIDPDFPVYCDASKDNEYYNNQFTRMVFTPETPRKILLCVHYLFSKQELTTPRSSHISVVYSHEVVGLIPDRVTSTTVKLIVANSPHSMKGIE